MTGPELRQLRTDLGDALGKALSTADMAKLCGLAPNEADTFRRWEVSGLTGPAAELLRIKRTTLVEKLKRIGED